MHFPGAATMLQSQFPCTGIRPPEPNLLKPTAVDQIQKCSGARYPFRNQGQGMFFNISTNYKTKNTFRAFSEPGSGPGDVPGTPRRSPGYPKDPGRALLCENIEN